MSLNDGQLRDDYDDGYNAGYDAGYAAGYAEAVKALRQDTNNTDDDNCNDMFT